MSKARPKMTFSEYWKSKDCLISANDETPRVVTEYRLNKYCKIPLYETLEQDSKEYISFKPNDCIKVHWEYHNLLEPTPKYITVVREGAENINYFPCWNNKKMIKWVDTNTTVNN